MKKALFFVLALAAGTAFAGSCPTHMKAIDTKLATKPALSSADMTKVQSLRADGEKFHNEGKHDDSMKALSEAKKMLGI